MNELSSAPSSHFTMCHIYRGTFTEDYMLKAACSPFTHVRTSSRLPNEAHAHIYFELQIDFFPLEYFFFTLVLPYKKINIYCKSDEMHTDIFIYSLLHYTCSTCFGCYLRPSSEAQTAEYSRRYAWLLWCVGSWIVHWSRLRLGHPHTYSTVSWIDRAVRCAEPWT
jgi:hypothetical protein